VGELPRRHVVCSGGRFAHRRGWWGISLRSHRFRQVCRGTDWLVLASLGHLRRAVNTNLFLVYLSAIWPQAGHAWLQGTLMATLLAIPTLANYRGVRYGAILSADW
jgi:hypothetical protein